jgi:hypothetical protein
MGLWREVAVSSKGTGGGGVGREGGRRVAYYCIIRVYNGVSHRFARGLGPREFRVACFMSRQMLVRTRA